MLQAIRSRVSSWVVKALFALLILSFAVWGVGDMVGGGGARQPVAEVAGTPISQAELDQRFRGLVNQYRQFFGPDFDAERARGFGLLDQALEALVQEAVLGAAAARTGLRVDDALVRQAIVQIPAFQGLGGRFDPDRFRAVLAQNGLSEAELVARLRRDIAQQQVVGAVAVGAAAPAPVVDGLYRFQGERRVLEAVLVPDARFAELPQPEDAVLARVHAENPQPFTRPETRDLTMLVVDVDDLLDEVAATEAEIAELYEIRRAEFGTPERRSVDMVMVDDASAAALLADAARASGDLAAAAREAGYEVIPVENARRGDLFLPAIGEAAFALPEGGVSDPVQTGFGYYVVQARAVAAASERPLEEVREQLALDVRREKAADRLFEFANRIEDSLAGGASLEETARRFSLELVSVRGVSATGATEDGSQPQVAGLREILDTAFRQAPGRESRMLETRAGTYYSVRVDRVEPSALRPLAEVRGSVLAFWQSQERRRLARAMAEEVAGRVRAGAQVADAAAAEALEPAQTGPVSRDARGANVAPEIVREGFALPAGGVGIAETAAGPAVVRVSEIRAADPAAADQQARAAIAAQVQQAVAEDLVAQFSRALRGEIAVQIDRAAVARVAGN